MEISSRYIRGISKMEKRLKGEKERKKRGEEISHTIVSFFFEVKEIPFSKMLEKKMC
jgi:hypothetical protein